MKIVYIEMIYEKLVQAKYIADKDADHDAVAKAISDSIKPAIDLIEKLTETP